MQTGCVAEDVGRTVESLRWGNLLTNATNPKVALATMPKARPTIIASLLDRLLTKLIPVSGGMLHLATAFIACLLLGSAAVSAAEIRVDPSSAATKGAVFEGKIEAGDFEKFKGFILNNEKTTELYLASPGGDLNEAVKIGLLVRALKLWTVVPSKTLTDQRRDLAAARHDLKDAKDDYKCASACFFIFVAGVHRSSDDQGPPILGIHRPSLAKNDLSRFNIDQKTMADARMRAAVEKYLKLMDVPSKYAENMYSVPRGSIRWIRYDEFQADFAGFISEDRH